ncbi:MAG: hypothetical protein R3C59_24580 [Planctomycetaceae bacterium]
MKTLASVLALCLIASSAHASVISGGTAGDFTLGTTGDSSKINGRLDGAVTIGAVDPTANAGGGDYSSIAVDMDVTAFVKHDFFDIEFDLGSIIINGPVVFLDSNITGRVYDFTVTLQNLVGSGLGSSIPSDAGDNIGPFDIEIDGGPAGLRFLNGPINTLISGTNSIGSAPGGYFGYVNDKKLTFGGLNGSGVQIPNGGSQDFTFSLYVPNSNDDFRLRFTANPEPGALALAAIAMIPCGVVIRRRRKAAAASKV